MENLRYSAASCLICFQKVLPDSSSCRGESICVECIMSLYLFVSLLGFPPGTCTHGHSQKGLELHSKTGAKYARVSMYVVYVAVLCNVWTTVRDAPNMQQGIT